MQPFKGKADFYKKRHVFWNINHEQLNLKK
jgi:hypothetical protein